MNSAGGFVLTLNDGSLEWRNPDGSLKNSANVSVTCKSGTELRVQGGGSQVNFYAVSANNDNPPTYSTLFGTVGTEGKLNTIYKANLSYLMSHFDFAGALALAEQGKPLLSQRNTLEVPSLWKQTYAQAQNPVTANVKASYVDQSSYAIARTLIGPTGMLNMNGKGSSSNAKLIFKQALCVDGASFWPLLSVHSPSGQPIYGVAQRKSAS